MSEVAILLLINHLQSLVILFKNFARLSKFFQSIILHSPGCSGLSRTGRQHKSEKELGYPDQRSCKPALEQKLKHITHHYCPFLFEVRKLDFFVDFPKTSWFALLSAQEKLQLSKSFLIKKSPFFNKNCT